MTMRTLFWTTLVLGLCFATPLHAQEGPSDPPVERQVIVMFETDGAALPNGATRAEIGQARLPGQVKSLLQRAGARRIAKGFPDFRRADTLRVLEDGRAYRVPDYTNLFVVTLPPNANRDSVVARLNQLPGVQYGEKNQRPAPRVSSGNRSQTVSSRARKSGTNEVIPPNQDDFDKQWGLRNTSGPDIEATKAWTYTKGSSNITVGVVDGGVEGAHVDLSGKVNGYTNPSTDHGTSVAGIAAAKGDNPSGKVAGVDWRAQIHSEPLSGLVSTAQSIDDAVMAGASVINNSWGFANRSSTLTQALRSAYEADVLLVHANPYKTGSDADTSPYPNNVGPWIVNVGAMTKNGAASSYTGSRSFTDVGAPGNDIRTTVLGSNHDDKTGTSFAAPFVTGTASLLLSAEPNLRNYDIEHLLERTAQSYGSGRDPEVGYGMIDANAAVKRVSDPYEVTHGTASFTKIYDDDNVSFPDGFTKDNGTHYGAGTYICDIYKLSASASSPVFDYEEKPWFWLPVTEKGFSAANPNDGNRYLSKSVSKNSAEATTYFYNCSNTLGQNIGWVPFDPTAFKHSGSFRWTAIGDPAPIPVEVSISGPNWLDNAEQGTWTASVSGGAGTASYNWEHMPVGASTWYSTSCSGASCSNTFYNYGSSQVKKAHIRVTVTKGSEQDQTSASVYVYPAGGYYQPLAEKSSTKSIGALQGLDASANGGGTAELKWSTTAWLPRSEFVVQHRRDSTAAWSRLGTVASGDSVGADTSRGAAYRFRTKNLSVGTHQFRLQVQAEGAKNALTSRTVSAKITMDEAYRLSTYPNPVRERATVELAVQKRQEVSVRLYDVLGRRVATLHDGALPAQELRRFRVDASVTGLTSGTYFLRVTGENFAATERITVVR